MVNTKFGLVKLVLVIALFASGCSVIEGDVSKIADLLERDFARAAEIATVNNDANAAKCFTHLASVVKETQKPELKAQGIFSLLEKARALKQGSGDSKDKFYAECGALSAEIMLLIAKTGATRGMGF